MTFTAIGYKPKPIFNVEPDCIERALILIDKHEASFETEISELQTGLELIEKILEGMRIIQTQ
jgi:hypothetical protein